ncbi:TadE-like protein [Streptosporangium canum]|uniref:TadE-like protein n=1 Tax=Streptosporangium canum TaxID=324952 RepID=A0A1I3FIM8_9ACTN|nr:TadE/TadG family type IV pilus assembly protein [Streptosporangium canum]SFI10972.1 TadE-like protein [Streptosporangium canum]
MPVIFPAPPRPGRGRGCARCGGGPGPGPGQGRGGGEPVPGHGGGGAPGHGRGGGRRGGERGSLTAETVLLAPVFLLFMLFLVGAGRVVEAQGEVNGAARDAARAASVERTLSDAEDAADRAAKESLSGECEPEVSLAGTDWKEGALVRVEVTCSLDLDFLGFGAAKEMKGDSVVPLEQFRRVE